MSKINDGGPAFPMSRSHFNQDGRLTTMDMVTGMSIRQWYAGEAMAALMANPTYSTLGAVETANYAFMQADAMIASESKGGAA